MLCVSPSQQGRLVEIARNLPTGINEARANGWLGEVQGFQVNLDAAGKKLASLERLARNNAATGPINIGMPILRG
jgi:hypothetical protein